MSSPTEATAAKYKSRSPDGQIWAARSQFQLQLDRRSRDVYRLDYVRCRQGAPRCFPCATACAPGPKRDDETVTADLNPHGFVPVGRHLHVYLLALLPGRVPKGRKGGGLLHAVDHRRFY
ncbi:uncharacterized protein PpBr36_10951, partial [Pyricularia pennisetigena]|uniref:uncharacterized protein n=1 Tax=Pyricularia pennisetigena TaxID=1578925 RepID=UPI00114E575A